jgi:hypothetical protein
LLGLVLSYAALLANGSAGPKQTDFVPYYTAATLVLHGDGAQLYDQLKLGHVESNLVRPLHVRDGVMPWLYPAFFAVAIAPLALLPYDAAFAGWVVLNCLLLLAVVAALSRFARFKGSSVTLWWVSALSFLPVLMAIAQGQASIVILALLVGAFVLSGAGGSRAPVSSRVGDAMAGALLALALIKPPYVLPVLAVFVIWRRWWLLGSFGLSAGLLLALPMVPCGPGCVTGFVATMSRASGWSTQIGGFQPKFNQSLSGFVQLLVAAPWAQVLIIGLDLAALSLVIHRAGFGRRPAAFCAAVVCGLLIGPHVLVHDLSLLLLPAVVAVATGPHDLRLSLLLVAGYCGVVAGLALAPLLHIQIATVLLGLLLAWFTLSDFQSRGPLHEPHVRRLPAGLSATPIRRQIMRSIHADR